MCGQNVRRSVSVVSGYECISARRYASQLQPLFFVAVFAPLHVNLKILIVFQKILFFLLFYKIFV